MDLWTVHSVGSLSSKFSLFTLPHELDEVVDDNGLLVRAPVEDSSAVAAPRAGVDGDGERPHVGEVVHHGGVVVARQHLVTAEGRGRQRRGRDALKCLPGCALNFKAF